LQYLSVIGLALDIYRIAFLFLLPTTFIHISEGPQELILITVGQMVANTLAYIFIVANWAERISIDNYRKRLENTEIRTLLEERELLVGSLLKANKTSATGALSASIAHELNQPLAATSLNIQLLQKKLAKGDLGPSTQKEVFATLLSDNERAASIIRSLKSIFSDQDVSVESVSFPNLLNSIVTILNPELKSKEIQLNLDIDPELSMRGNPDELRQILMNLLGNAIQALSEIKISPKIIAIKGRYTLEGIEIAVADNGVGIPDKYQEALFELLTGSKTKGMGLGLWLCKHIVTRHGGRIFYRKAKEGGAEFVIILPLISPL
jgi:signal transduction histidine kinase